MSATKSDIVASSSSPNPNDSIERLNNFDLRLQALSQHLMPMHVEDNETQYDPYDDTYDRQSMCY